MASQKKATPASAKPSKTITEPEMAVAEKKNRQAKPALNTIKVEESKPAPAKKGAVTKSAQKTEEKEMPVKVIAGKTKTQTVKKKEAETVVPVTENITAKPAKNSAKKAEPVAKPATKKAEPAVKVAEEKPVIKTAKAESAKKTEAAAEVKKSVSAKTEKATSNQKEVKVAEKTPKTKEQSKKSAESAKSEASALARKNLPVRSSHPTVVSRPAPTPSAISTDKKPQVIIAHRGLGSKANENKDDDALSTYQPEVYRSILDDASSPSMVSTVYRYNDEDLAEFKELIAGRIEAARKELIYLQGLITRKDEAGTEDTENRFNNIEDGSGAMEREQLAQLASRQIQFMNHLEKALLRIENKTYGICRVTGKLIDKARLRAVPHATLSIEAKKMMAGKPGQ